MYWSPFESLPQRSYNDASGRAVILRLILRVFWGGEFFEKKAGGTTCLQGVICLTSIYKAQIWGQIHFDSWTPLSLLPEQVMVSSVLFWLLLASEDNDGSNVDNGGHGLRQQQDACIVDKDNNSCGTYIVEDKRRGGTANPSIGGEGVRWILFF